MSRFHTQQEQSAEQDFSRGRSACASCRRWIDGKSLTNARRILSKAGWTAEAIDQWKPCCPACTRQRLADKGRKKAA